MTPENIQVGVTDCHGVEIAGEFATLVFRPDHLTGYWIVNDPEGMPVEICAYIGAERFYIAYSEDTVNRLYRILNMS